MATKNPDVPKPQQIRKLRESAGLTQTAAANLLFVTLRTWQNWEAGKHEMNAVLWDVFKCHCGE